MTSPRSFGICKQCSRDFDRVDLLPKILECGHSICSACLTDALETSLKCPECNIILTKTIALDLPINLDILEAIDYCNQIDKDSRAKSKAILEKKKQIKKIHDFTGKIEAITMENEAEQVENVGVSEETLESPSLSINLDDDLKSKHLKANCCPISVDVSLENFENGREFMLEVCKMCADGKVFAVHLLRNERIFGKITIEDDEMFIHALLPLNDEDQLDIKTVWFQDLMSFHKLCNPYDRRIFLKIFINKYNMEKRILIEMKFTSLASRFIKLCTGEYGRCFIGKKYDKSYFSANNYNYTSLKFGEANYTASLMLTAFGSEATTYSEDSSSVLVADASGSFEILGSILRNTSFPSKVIIGTLLPPIVEDTCISNNGNPPHMKIADCGVVVKLSKLV